MSVSGFDQLVAGIARLTGQDMPELPADPSAIRSLNVTIDTVEFRLACMPDLRPDCALVFCVFGALPAGRESDALKRLMSLNFKLFCAGGLRFAIDESNGTVLGCYDVPYAECTANSVLDELEHVVNQVEAWRKTHFLHDRKNGTARPDSGSDLLHFA